MPRLSAAPIALTPEEELELQRLTRALKTPRNLGERAEMILRSAGGTEGARDCASAWRLARDGAPLARALVGQFETSVGRGAVGRRAALGVAYDVHARPGLRAHGADRRAAGEERSAAQSLT